MELIVSSQIVAALLAEAARALPNESCGLLWGTASPGPMRLTRIQSTANVAHDTRHHFEIDPAALFAAHRAARANNTEALLGYYHSHPTGPAAPSATDRAGACGDGRIWAIVAIGRLGFWRDTAQGFMQLSTCVSGD